MKDNINKSTLAVFIFLSISVLILIIFVFRILFDGYGFWSDTKVEYDVSGQIGDFIGGVVGTILSAAGFYFLYITLQEQRQSFEKERLESKYFELIKLHRDNVSELKFNGEVLIEDEDSLYIENLLYEGKSVFRVIFNQFIICRNELLPLFHRINVYKQDYEEKLKSEPFIIRNNIDIKMLAKIDICYCIVFYGLSSEGTSILKSIFKEKYKDEYINEMLNYLSLKPAKDNRILDKWKIIAKKNSRHQILSVVNDVYNWRKTKIVPQNCPYGGLLTGFDNKYIKYYGGHQFRLGHYFRHLFQTVKFINSQTNIDYKTKYGYIKILRAQLSTYEQAILFLNSLSKVGEPWEFNPEISFNSHSILREDFELITKYNLIKNIPGDSIYGIHFKDYYPNIDYEGDIIKKKRAKYD